MKIFDFLLPLLLHQHPKEHKIPHHVMLLGFGVTKPTKIDSKSLKQQQQQQQQRKAIAKSNTHARAFCCSFQRFQQDKQQRR